MIETIYGKTDRKILSNRKRRPLHKTTEQYIAEAIQKHGSKYDYSRTVYNGSHYSLTVICPQHGSFEQMAKEHLQYGCRKCADAIRPILQKYTAKEFIKKAQSRHGDKYDYSKVDYRGTETSVEIICRKHGSFFQTPHDHYGSEAGCSRCTKSNTGGYSINRFSKDPALACLTGVLYLVRLNNKVDVGENCLKIGVTKRTINQRFYGIKSYEIMPIHELTTTIQQAFIWEQEILEKFSDYKIDLDWIGYGRTECFRPEALLGLCEWMDDIKPLECRQLQN